MSKACPVGVITNKTLERTLQRTSMGLAVRYDPGLVYATSHSIREFGHAKRFTEAIHVDLVMDFPELMHATPMR